MSEKKENSVEKERLEELRKLKRENRRRNVVLLVTALQLSSLFALYYLGRTSH